MLNNIGYLAYISTVGILLLLSPSYFIKKVDNEQEQSFINTQLSVLLQTELGLRMCGLYHLILLAAQILKQEKVKLICLNVYALFLISLIGGLCFDGVGQIQSERLERFGFQAGIFSFILFNNWPNNQQKQESKKDSKVIQEQSETSQTIQKSEQNRVKEKSSEDNTGKEIKQSKKKGKAKNE
ncbi:unnamed protein product [Paramecium sonneborni]|uniref:Transmembrane protein n=1 Tax=Paramecium sonneborni TaxID=65129 RepID=A0A8S1NNW0_9CILI|nr:unnamed protein product [Paramecium sonneborni]